MAKFLEPAGPDRFTAAEWFMAEVHFLRDTTHGNSAMTLGGGRVGLPFNRRFAASTLSAMTTWRADARNDASDANPGTAQQRVRSVVHSVGHARWSRGVLASASGRILARRLCGRPGRPCAHHVRHAIDRGSNRRPPDSAGSMAVRVALVNNNLPV